MQDFYPTPGTISTCMYYTGLDPTTLRGDDPSTMQKVYVPRDPHEKAMQRALIQYRDPGNYALVKEALLREGRQDLIGFGDKFLIPPREPRGDASKGRSSGSSKRGRAGDAASGGSKPPRGASGRRQAIDAAKGRTGDTVSGGKQRGASGRRQAGDAAKGRTGDTVSGGKQRGASGRRQASVVSSREKARGGRVSHKHPGKKGS